MSDDLCGGECADGSKCQRSAGWGTESDLGPCVDHDDSTKDSTGRDTKLTEQRQEDIARMLEEGHSIGAAARSNGITVQTFFNWMERGKETSDAPFAEFFDRITRARGTGEARYVDAIVEIAKENGDTATLMSLLKSRYPDAWADVERGDQTGGVEVVIPETSAE
jgi:hypothetical protein